MTEMISTEDDILMAMEDDGFFDDLASLVMSAENPQEEEMLEKPSIPSPSSEVQKPTTSNLGPTGRPPIPLYLSCNPDKLSEYQCLIRKEMEFFEALQLEVDSNAKGRNRPVVLGQVGIRCRHCRFVGVVGPRQAFHWQSRQHFLLQVHSNSLCLGDFVIGSCRTFDSRDND